MDDVTEKVLLLMGSVGSLKRIGRHNWAPVDMICKSAPVRELINEGYLERSLYGDYVHLSRKGAQWLQNRGMND